MNTQQNTAVFFYGFPKNNVTSNQIRLKIIELTKIDVEHNMPQIRRDINKPEWNAVVKFKTPEEQKKVLEKMKFFKWEGFIDKKVEKQVVNPDDPTGKPLIEIDIVKEPVVLEIRALGHDPEVKNREDPEVRAKNVFCRQLPAGMTHSGLHEELKKHVSGEGIKSVKVAFDPEINKSRKYGFASFTSKEAAQQYIDRSTKEQEPLKPFVEAKDKAKAELEAVFEKRDQLIQKKYQQGSEEAKKLVEEEQKEVEEVYLQKEQELLEKEEALKNESKKLGLLFHEYNPKNKAEMRQVFNNVIVKGFQQDESKVDDPAYLEDRNAYLTKIFERFGILKSVCAKKVNSKKVGAPKSLLAFVCFSNPDTAAKAVEEVHEKEIDGKKIYVAEALKKQQLAKEIFKFKNAKKRCNLFVRNFPPDTTEAGLRAFIEGISGPESIESTKLGMDKQDPTKAKYAFVCLKTPDLANKVKQQIATNQDLSLGGAKLSVNNYEPKEVREIQQKTVWDKADYAKATSQGAANPNELLQKPELVQTLMYLMQTLQSQGRPLVPRQQRAGHQGGHRGNFQGQQQMGGRQGFNQPMPQAQMQPRPMHGGMPMGQMPPQGMPPQGMHPGAMGGMPQPQMQQNPLAMQYLTTVNPIIPGVVESNEHAKDFVGEKIYEFVLAIAGEQHAPKITGMLIDLPLEEIRDYLMDFNKFEKKVQQAKTLLTSQQ